MASGICQALYEGDPLVTVASAGVAGALVCLALSRYGGGGGGGGDRGGGGVGYGGIDYGRTFRGGCGGADVAGAGLRYVFNSGGKAWQTLIKMSFNTFAGLAEIARNILQLFCQLSFLEFVATL